MSVFLVASSPPLKSPKYLPNKLFEEIPNVFLPLGNVSAVSTKKQVKHSKKMIIESNNGNQTRPGSPKHDIYINDTINDSKYEQ